MQLSVSQSSLSATMEQQPPTNTRPPMLLPDVLAQTVTKTPSRKRSWSDSGRVLDPSPKFKEPTHRISHDDDVSLNTPSKVPRRTDPSTKGLILQMPPRDLYPPFSTSSSSSGTGSAQVEPREVWGSPSSVLPRHSRGLDFSRACTNLHHSTLADPSSPESSPIVAQKTFGSSSRRGSTYSMMLDSPRMSSAWMWPGTPTAEKNMLSRSLGSTNALTSDASSSSSDEEDAVMDQDDTEDAIISTPHVRKAEATSMVTPYSAAIGRRDDNGAANNESPISNAFVRYRRNVLGRRHLKRGSDYFGIGNRTASPEPQSTIPDAPAVTSTGHAQAVRSPPSRRESLSLGIGNVLHISSSNESSDEGAFGITPMTPGVVRRPVTRRSNLLPKTKTFARVRAALQEEGAPVDSEARRESEVVRQVRVKDIGLKKEQSGATVSSPELIPSVPNMSHEGSDMSDIEALGVKGGLELYTSTAPEAATETNGKPSWIRRSGGTQTPPPPVRPPQRSLSGVSDDVGMDSPQPSSSLSTASTSVQDTKPEPDAPIAASFQPPSLPSAAEISKKVGKRRRDEDFDINAFKRRAVSPGLSVQSSPVLGQSPISSGSNLWGPPRPPRERSSTAGSATEERSGSSGSLGQTTPVMGPKRVGLQGMTDTSDGMMNMSIE